MPLTILGKHFWSISKLRGTHPPILRVIKSSKTDKKLMFSLVTTVPHNVAQLPLMFLFDVDGWYIYGVTIGVERTQQGNVEHRVYTKPRLR